SLQRRHGQSQGRTQSFNESPHGVVVLRFRIKFVAARHFANFQPALVLGEARDQFVKHRPQLGLFHANRGHHLVDRRRLVRGINHRLKRALQFRWIHCHSSFVSTEKSLYKYCSSISVSGFSDPSAANTVSNILCFLSRISLKCSDCISTTACSRTISSTARNATIIAWRVAHASKNVSSSTPSSLTIKSLRNNSIICATVNCW